MASATTICERLNSEIRAAPQIKTSGELAALIPRRAVLEMRAVEELRQLTPPTSLAHSWDLVLRLRSTLAHELTALAGDAKRNDVAAIHALAASKARVHRELVAAADTAGLAPCGHTGDA
jgi:hypothetical protein